MCAIQRSCSRVVPDDMAVAQLGNLDDDEFSQQANLIGDREAKAKSAGKLDNDFAPLPPRTSNSSGNLKDSKVAPPSSAAAGSEDDFNP